MENHCFSCLGFYGSALRAWDITRNSKKKKIISKGLRRIVEAGMSVIDILSIINTLFENVLPAEADYIMGGAVLADTVMYVHFGKHNLEKE